MKITKEIVRISVAKLEQSLKIALTEFILNVDEIGCWEWLGQKFRQILTGRHVQSLDIKYPAPQGEKLINSIATKSMARGTLTGMFVIHRKGIENAI
jgi:hypothetical protein